MAVVIIKEAAREALAKGLPVVFKVFDEDQHPRDDSGRFTVGDAVGFASPNRDNLSFDDANNAIGGERHKFIRQAFNDVDHEMGILPWSTHDVIGAWSDGAENSAMNHFGPMGWGELRAVMAMKGYLAGQKQVLIFQERDTEATDFLANFEVKGSVKEIHQKLLADGLEFHTLEPSRGGARVFIYGSGQDAVDKVRKAAERYGSKPQVHLGKGEFIGTTLEGVPDAVAREDARRVYEDVIKLGGLRGSAERWPMLRDRWRAVADAAKALVRKYSEDQPRADDGKWTSGGGSSQVTSSPEFRSWFGASKVKTSSGEPLVVYHGTRSSIGEFQPGYNSWGNQDFSGRKVFSFSTDPEFANRYAGDKSGASIYPVYIKADNPGDFRNPAHVALMLADAYDKERDFVVRAKEAHPDIWTPERVSEYLTMRDAGNKELIEHGAWQLWERPDTWKKFGWDGAWVREAPGSKHADVLNIVVADPKQIKSATGNSGKFDPLDPRLGKYSPDQARDEHGRWTEGATSAVDAFIRGNDKELGYVNEDTGGWTGPAEMLAHLGYKEIHAPQGVAVALRHDTGLHTEQRYTLGSVLTTAGFHAIPSPRDATGIMPIGFAPTMHVFQRDDKYIIAQPTYSDTDASESHVLWFVNERPGYLKKYSDDQLRDEGGRWTSGAGGTSVYHGTKTPGFTEFSKPNDSEYMPDRALGIHVAARAQSEEAPGDTR